MLENNNETEIAAPSLQQHLNLEPTADSKEYTNSPIRQNANYHGRAPIGSGSIAGNSSGNVKLSSSNSSYATGGTNRKLPSQILKAHNLFQPKSNKNESGIGTNVKAAAASESNSSKPNSTKTMNHPVHDNNKTIQLGFKRAGSMMNYPVAPQSSTIGVQINGSQTGKNNPEKYMVGEQAYKIGPRYGVNSNRSKKQGSLKIAEQIGRPPVIHDDDKVRHRAGSNKGNTFFKGV